MTPQLKHTLLSVAELLFRTPSLRQLLVPQNTRKPLSSHIFAYPAINMHKCLQIPEIIERIFKVSDSPSTLASSARTCYFFSEPALNALLGIHGTLGAILLLMDLNDYPLLNARTLQRSNSELEKVRQRYPYRKPVVPDAHPGQYYFRRLTKAAD